MNLIEEVKEQLNARRGSWKQISKETGVSYSYLSKFMNDKFENPGYMTLMELKKYFEQTTAA